MGVYIKEYQIPNSCEDCFINEDICDLWEDIPLMERGEVRHEHCPLVEVLTPHGKLIDADKLYTTVQSNESADAYVRFLLRHSPTVIEAESEAPATEPEADKDSRGNMSLKPPGDSISRSDAKDKAKEIMYSILDDTDYNDIESMAHACLMMKIKILKMFDEFPSAEAVQGWIPCSERLPNKSGEDE